MRKKIVPAAYDWLMDWSAISTNFCWPIKWCAGPKLPPLKGQLCKQRTEQTVRALLSSYWEACLSNNQRRTNKLSRKMHKSRQWLFQKYLLWRQPVTALLVHTHWEVNRQGSKCILETRTTLWQRSTWVRQSQLCTGAEMSHLGWEIIVRRKKMSCSRAIHKMIMA